ncbi:MAG TPA: twin transmembrane helix small protein [Burkholderiales bacterium]|nr:twin transmembrane helix small protein [Burkholderiales bacterium]
MRYVVLAFVVLILASLFSGLFFLIRDQGKSKRTVKALTWRVGFSLALFLLLLAGYYFGLIKPHGVG